MMDPMVIKYLGLAGITYGSHAYLAVVQVLLCTFLVYNGIMMLSSNMQVGKWSRKFGIIVNPVEGGSNWKNWLMIITGIAFILPIFGITHWIVVLACPVAIYMLINLTAGLADPQIKKTGNIARKVLTVSALLVFGFTLWEGRDLVRVGWDVNYKAIYWRNKEVSGWQKENNPNVPKPGDLAPDFELTDVNGTKTMRLSDFRGKRPVVLLFGSFT
jgi:hypothetical protein